MQPYCDWWFLTHLGELRISKIYKLLELYSNIGNEVYLEHMPKPLQLMTSSKGDKNAMAAL